MEKSFTAKFDVNNADLVTIELENDGIRTCKRVHFSKFVSLIAGTVNDSDGIFFDKEDLPKGYCCSKISKFQEDTFSVLLALPAQRRGVIFYETGYAVPFPEIVFLFEVGNGFLNRAKCFSKKGDNLYKFPFANVYNNGDICWGRNQLPEIKHISEVDKYVELFFGSSYNNDLFTPPKGFEKECSSMRGFLEVLEKEMTFPDQFLVSCNSTIMTLKNYIMSSPLL